MSVVTPAAFPTDTIRGSHAIAGRCDVYVAGVKVSELGVVDGEVILDRTRFIRGTCTVELLADWPESPSSPLNPYSSEVQLYRGAMAVGAEAVLVPVGRYRVDHISSDPNRRTTVVVSGSSREVYLADDRFDRPVSFSAEPAADRLVRLITETRPEAAVTVLTTNPGSASGVWDEDRAACVADLARACAGEVFADYEGTGFTLAPTPKLSDPYTFVVDAGSVGVLVAAEESLTREGIYNAVTVRTQSSSEEVPPVQATAYDMNPSSPTYWDGPFGHRRRYYSSPVLTTVEQCQSAADAMLDDALGLHHSVEIVSVANPALRPGDVVRVVFGDGTTQDHLVDALTVPMGLTATQRLVTRATQEIIR